MKKAGHIASRDASRRFASRARPASRRGAVLFAALLALGIVLMLAAVLARASLAQHRQSLRRQQELQALWLAESAAERAAARLAADASYQGETWRPASSDDAGAGEASIRIEPTEDGGRRIAIEARFPADPVWGVVARKQIRLSPEQGTNQ